MCLAIPGKVLETKGDSAIVDFDGIQKEVNAMMVRVRKGDWVLVHVGFAIQKIDEVSARKTYKLLSK